MKRLFIILFLLLFITSNSQSQDHFDYSVHFTEIHIPGLPGVHSYAFGQHDGKWLIIGGRKDGLHARQPFNAFQPEFNNSDILVIDMDEEVFWNASVEGLPTPIAEQLQSTNMNFYQDSDTLYIIGGYAKSATQDEYITFPNLTTVIVSETIDAIVNGQPIAPFFKQITDDIFAITGGQLGKIDNTFYLVGGHRFDGRYNPMNNPTYVQTYSHQIRKFYIDNSGDQLSYSDYQAITDPVHLRRRDYNLVPQVFTDGTFGYTISAGVFQVGADLPFLYPVDITAQGYEPITGFNQYLSHYHGAKAAIFDAGNNQMHSLFFGGMSQYYYQDGQLVQDDLVPFVRTISRVTRYADGSLHEYQFDMEMPGLKGASAKYIPNLQIPYSFPGIVNLNENQQDTILIGHIFGGIVSPTLNPFANNQTHTTYADSTIYAVRIINNSSSDDDDDDPPVGVFKIDGSNPYDISVSPNPASGVITISYELEKPVTSQYFIVNARGQLIQSGTLQSDQSGLISQTIDLDQSTETQMLFLTVVFDNRYFVSRNVLYVK